jgi:hypothetical protein
VAVVAASKPTEPRSTVVIAWFLGTADRVDDVLSVTPLDAGRRLSRCW